MRTWVSIAAALAAVSCGGGGEPDGGDVGPPMSANTVHLPAEFVLGFGETIHIEFGVSLEFTSVVNDSRCSTNTTCAMDGNARILLSTETPRIAEVHELNTSPQFPTRANFDGDNYVVSLRKLTPLPANGPVPVTAYEATIYVERITYHIPTGP